jgi:putative serine protease PepD
MAAPQPSSLWIDPSQPHARHPWLEAAVVSPPEPDLPPPPPPEPPRRRGPLRRIAGLLLVVVVAALAAAGTVAVLDHGGSSSTIATKGTVKPLPASPGGTSSTRINEFYSRVSAAVVYVQVDEGNGQGASGTGFVIGSDGTIVTNAHVASGAKNIKVRFADNSQAIPATVVGIDASSDLAVLKVDPAKAPPLTVLPLADSDQVKVGDTAIAIGFPLGLDRTATAGIISGVGRSIKAPNGFTIDKVLQTDAPINPGNSGGPLLDDRGRVIGVNSQIATAGGGGGNVGIGFAVPSNTVREVVPRLQAGQSIKRPYLGVSTGVSTSGVSGAAVGEVTPGGPADKAGLQAGQGGDVIVSIDGQVVASPDDVSRLISGKHPGDTVKLGIARGGSRSVVPVTLGTRPDQLP